MSTPEKIIFYVYGIHFLSNVEGRGQVVMRHALK